MRPLCLQACIAQWLKTGSDKTKTCPGCRTKITAEPVPVKSLDNAIDMIAKSSLSEDEQKVRKEKQQEATKVTMPKVVNAAVAAPKPAAGAGYGGWGGFVAPAAAYGGFGLGGLGMFGGLFGGVPAAAAPVAAAAAGGGGRGMAYDGGSDEELDDEYMDRHRARTSIRLEHARSGRSHCRVCRSTIGHGQPRFAVVESSPYDQYESEKYYHVHCYAPEISRDDYPDLGSIRGFESLTAGEQAAVRAARR